LSRFVAVSTQVKGVKILVTGSCGLIGSEAVRYFDALGHCVIGVDNNMRAVFFGPDGDTGWVREDLIKTTSRYRHFNIDIRNREAISELFERERFDAVFHCAAQPSHDRAAAIPFDDFDVNAAATLNLLEANRRYSPEAVFVYMSTNKVYGDAPNRLSLSETDTRWIINDADYVNGIPEGFAIDQSMHSLFGTSKLAADILVQEYGRYFGMPTCCLRGGCLTGPAHSGVELHGFLSYLVKCNLEGRRYTVFGYRAKQVRDNIHSADVVRFVECFMERPVCAAVYNIGGGFDNSVSMLEAFSMVERITGRPMVWSYSEQARAGDHICYYSDLRKIRTDYPDWDITISLRQIVEQIADAWQRRLKQRV
jgi:CDP-paratose 2-epimerase